MQNRRTILSLLSASLAMPRLAFAATPKDVKWDDLIPPGFAYPQIIGEGEMDMVQDTWNPIYDANATKLNESLNGAYIKMPGYIVPLKMSADGVREFLLVPYVGACIHTPPPPPNQLVMVNTDTPWDNDQPWEAVWVTGMMHTQLQSTKLGETGYALIADHIEWFEW